MDALELIGQTELKRKIDALVEAAKATSSLLPHIILVGDEGLGKKQIARYIQENLDRDYKHADSKSLWQQGHLVGILTNVGEHNLLIATDIHLLPNSVTKILLTALSELKVRLIVGKGKEARQVELRIPQFSFIGTATEINRVDHQLAKAVFGIYFLSEYSNDELIKISQKIIAKNEHALQFDLAAIQSVVDESNANPGVASALIDKIVKYAKLKSVAKISGELVLECLDLSGHIRTSPVEKASRHISNNVKRIVWQRDEGKCVACGSNEFLEFDHIVPVSKGGSNTERNCQLLCEPCNRKKAAKIDG